jgi:beta-mannanase
LRYPVAIRFAHEMNGFWYPWCEQANANSAGEYVAAWRHVHDLFSAAGATNVTWVWSPNLSYTNSTPLRELYPGDDYVDWLGLSGYYGTSGTEQYRTFDELYGPTIAELRRFTDKPLVITEMAATDNAGRKAEWIRDFFDSLPQHPDIIGFVWYEAIKETDWRIVSSPASAAAFAAGVADSRFEAQWTPRSTLRTR